MSIEENFMQSHFRGGTNLYHSPAANELISRQFTSTQLEENSDFGASGRHSLNLKP